MLRALWFLLKASVLVAGVIWLIERPGHVSLIWQGYQIETSVGFTMVVLLVFLVVYTVLYRLWRAAVSIPDVYRRYKAVRQREKGYRDVTAGLVAIAAGDTRLAEKYARRAEYFIPDAPLTRLLTAQQYLLSGNIVKARRTFADLLEDHDAAFLGIRGLLQNTLQSKDYADALQYARQAEKLQPKREWVIRTLFDLETRNQEWERALKVLKKAERLNLFDAATVNRHRQAIFLALADRYLKKEDRKSALSWTDRAFACDPAFYPAAVLFAQMLDAHGKRKAAIKAIERAWVASPAAELGRLWMAFMPTGRKVLSPYDTGKDRVAWAKKLFDLKPEHRESLRLVGAEALKGRLWQEARQYLTKAKDFRLLSKLEQDETGNQQKAREWLELAADEPPESCWQCGGCGHAGSEWAALCVSCGIFNVAEWTVPVADIRGVANIPSPVLSGDILTPPGSLLKLGGS